MTTTKRTPDGYAYSEYPRVLALPRFTPDATGDATLDETEEAIEAVLMAPEEVDAFRTVPAEGGHLLFDTSDHIDDDRTTCSAGTCRHGDMRRRLIALLTGIAIISGG